MLHSLKSVTRFALGLIAGEHGAEEGDVLLTRLAVTVGALRRWLCPFGAVIRLIDSAVATAIGQLLSGWCRRRAAAATLILWRLRDG